MFPLQISKRMKILVNPSKKSWKKNWQGLFKNKGHRKDRETDHEKVKRQGDKALRKFAFEYDHVEIESIVVDPSEIENSGKHVDKTLKSAIKTAKSNIEKFHKLQETPDLSTEIMDGVTCMRRSVAIQKVGLYVPGGTAPLFSTVLMLGIPAKLAGCQEIVLCTPPGPKGQVHPAIYMLPN